MPINFSRTDVKIKPPSLIFGSKTYNKPYFYNTCDNTSSWEDKKLECSIKIPPGWKIIESTQKYPGNIYFNNGTVSQWKLPTEKNYTPDKLQDIIIDIITDSREDQDSDKYEKFITNLPIDSQLTLEEVRDIYNNNEEIYVLEPQSYDNLTKFNRSNFMYSEMRNNDSTHFGLFYSLPGDDKAVSGSGSDDWYKLDKSLYDYILKFE